MTATAVPAQLIPRQVLFGNPVKTSPKISPDGKKMAYIAPVDNVLNVWVKTVGTDDDQAITNDRDRGVRSYFWAEDGQQIFYVQDIGGNENWRLYAVDLATKQTRELTPFDDVQVQIIEYDKHRPDEMLIGLNKEDARLHDVYHLNLITGELDLIAKNPGNFVGWIVDAEFQVRGAMAATDDAGYDLLIRQDAKSDWQKLLTWDGDDSLNSGPVSFSKDGKYLCMRDSRQVNAGQLVKLDIATGEIAVIAGDPKYDVSGILIHPDTYEIQAVGFNKDRNEWQVLDQSIADDFDKIKQIHKGDFFLTSRDRADQTWLLGFTTDDGPVPYYAYDRQTKAATFLFANQPALAEYALAPMQPISFIAKDGLEIHGYLTCPVGIPQTNLPLVLNVHGGPWARDGWGYDPEAQWLANRGYACLQVNFRGSTGYGKDFVNAGDKEWGAKMHDDLLDAVSWSVNNGIADPKRVAIYGGSYGGYAALVGATFTPDVFACAVDIVGPSNLITLIQTIPPYWSTMVSTFHRRVGNPETEAEFLESRSPLSKVDQIKIPLLIAQGANDPRVKQAEAEQIVAAMESRNIEHEYLLFPDEGHGFAKPENRLKFYAATEKFLAKHLGGLTEEG